MRLNIGAGGQAAEGWTCLDRAFTAETKAKAAKLGPASGAMLMEWELTDLPLPFEDGTAQIAVAHHCLCMFADADLRALLGEVWRLLEPGGILRVSSVDFQYAIRALARRDTRWFYDLGVPMQASNGLALPGSAAAFARDAFIWYLDWGGARKTVLVSPEHLGIEYLAPAGFEWQQVAMNETVGPPGLCDFDSREGESWFLEARKP